MYSLIRELSIAILAVVESLNMHALNVDREQGLVAELSAAELARELRLRIVACAQVPRQGCAPHELSATVHALVGRMRNVHIANVLSMRVARRELLATRLASVVGRQEHLHELVSFVGSLQIGREVAELAR